MIAAALAFLRFIPLKAWLAAGCVLGLAFAFWLHGHERYKAGWADALATVSAQNDTAARAAKDAQSAVDDCYNAGKEWSVETGSCS